MATIVYDGHCPFCSRYADYLVAKQRYPNLQLLDAREQRDHPLLKRIASEGLVLDDGMVFELEGTLYHGADAVAMLARPGSLLSSNPSAHRAYPFMRAGRNLALKLIGRSKLGY
ncbi:MAG: DCC1-like thiol-disulfide oxidoreductase family protein [Pseudomonadota bacterium]